MRLGPRLTSLWLLALLLITGSAVARPQDAFGSDGSSSKQPELKE